MKSFNPLNFLNKIKEKFKSEVKFTLFTKIIPIGIITYLSYNIYKYKLYSFKDCCFELPEEKQIGKKLYPILKYKFIENYYEDDNPEVILIKSIYETLIKIFKLNLKAEVFLIKSDLQFFYILPTGSLFMSDNFYSHLKEKENFQELLCYFLIHNILHVKNRHATKNITKIYSKMDLLNQYEQLMGNGIGFEHYFLNYYLYLPLSKSQEEITIFESAKYLLDLDLISIKDIENKKNSIDFFFNELTEVLGNMKNYSKCGVDEIKNKLLEVNDSKKKNLSGRNKYYNDEITKIC